MQNKLVFVSFDIETGGEYYGIVHLSAKIMHMTCKNLNDTEGNWLSKGKTEFFTLSLIKLRVLQVTQTL